MGKKRKSQRQAAGPTSPQELDAADARLGPINSYRDIADEQDEHFDKILLDDEPKSKRLRREEQEDEFLQPSDEEVLGDSDDSDEDADEDDYAGGGSGRRGKGKGGDDSDEERERPQGEADEGWFGSSRQEWYNADKLETEEAALEEEAEARRIQKKKLAKMSEADFIFDDEEWLAPTTDARDGEDVVTETLKDIEITDDLSPEERYRLLKTRYPEFDHLQNEFQELQPLLAEYQKAAEGKASKSLEVIRYWILGAYVAALASYFAILTSPARDGNGSRKLLAPSELRDHDVMETLVSCRELWLEVKSLSLTAKASAVQTVTPPAEEGGEAADTFQSKASKKMAVDGDAEAPRPKKLSAADKEKKAKAKALEASLADLSNLLAKPRSMRKSKLTSAHGPEAEDDHSDLGDEEILDARTAADKAARKKSLRFYTSQIVQKSSKRANAGRDAGGDMDIPYRERLRDRQARLTEEAARRKSKLGADLGDGSEDDEMANKERDDADEGYYDYIVNQKQKKKADKEERRMAANLPPERIEEEVGEDGAKRAISWNISKNKGLTPNRKKKEISRVKKRRKYTEKTKKLSSMRAVWKGGEAKEGYQGEKSGIKTGLIKSIKL